MRILLFWVKIVVWVNCFCISICIIMELYDVIFLGVRNGDEIVYLINKFKRCNRYLIISCIYIELVVILLILVIIEFV